MTTDTAAVDAAISALGAIGARDVPLAPLTTYRVGGAASVFARVRSADDLRLVAAARAASGLAVLVVGRGSNLLVADDGFDGIALTIADMASWIELPATGDGRAPPAHGPVTVAVGGAVALPVLARRTAAAALCGFEWAVGVPGSIGGAVRMNAGGHGSDMAAVVADVDVVDLDDERAAGAPRRIAVDDLGLRFRRSDLTDEQVVVAARLLVHHGDRAASEAMIGEIVRWRREHQPGGQNAGSVFVNPVPGEVSAGSLVDALGLRGLRIRTACVSEKHANFIQADDGGRAADVRAVMEEVRARVATSTGFELRSEVRLIGFES